MRARQYQRDPLISEDHEPSIDAQTELALPSPLQPPAEATGRAHASTSTCAELPNLIDNTSGSPPVTANPVQIDTLLDAQTELALPPQPPAEATGRAHASTSTCVELPNLIDNTSGSPAVTENPV